MILLIDNYDSFVFNLARYVGELGFERQVVRNDAITTKQIQALDPQAIILSPGPCTPDEAGICLEIVRDLGSTYPLLGICLGHQTIAQAYGGTVRRAGHPRHGKSSEIKHKGHSLFDGLKSPFTAARYHALVADLAPEGPLHPTAWSQDDNELMGLAHETLPIVGTQFHPESILTPTGHQILQNFLTGIAGLSPSHVPLQSTPETT
ncbi:MAG: aminodeoxychorismate/anthranilate synthase component II [Parvibaculaceae bacterium]|nr:aminodeoxychorismate/anthranilate synthase component II [Parvibaculaceae bacterium]